MAYKSELWYCNWTAGPPLRMIDVHFLGGLLGQPFFSTFNSPWLKCLAKSCHINYDPNSWKHSFLPSAASTSGTSYDPLSGKVELLFCVIHIARCIDSGRSFIPPHMLLLCFRCCCWCCCCCYYCCWRDVLISRGTANCLCLIKWHNYKNVPGGENGRAQPTPKCHMQHVMLLSLTLPCDASINLHCSNSSCSCCCGCCSWLLCMPQCQRCRHNVHCPLQRLRQQLHQQHSHWQHVSHSNLTFAGLRLVCLVWTAVLQSLSMSPDVAMLPLPCCCINLAKMATASCAPLMLAACFWRTGPEVLAAENPGPVICQPRFPGTQHIYMYI